MTAALFLVMGLAAAAGPAAADDGGDGCARAKAAHAVARHELLAKHIEDPDHFKTDVLHYVLELEVDPGTRILDGTTTMTVKALVGALADFHFRLNSSMLVSAVRVNGRAAPWRRRPDGATIEAELDHAHDEGEIFTIEVAYRGRPAPSWFFSVEDGSPVVSTLSQPWHASDWWAVKDDNSDKATGELLITVPSELTAVANGVLESVENLAGNRRRFHWSTAYPTSPYLFAFAAAAYATFGETHLSGDAPVPVDFFVYRASDNPGNRSAWRLAVEMLATFEELFGDYPFKEEKYAIYQFPFGGGMEHQTATGQGGTSAFSENLTAHELAHQWWGDLVTCATWHDIWLNEGFATYATALWHEFASGAPDAGARRAYMESRRPAQLDGSVWVDDVSDQSRIFSSNYSYSKGAWVVHMLRGVVGDGAFFDTLAAYRERHAYATATTDDLRTVAEEVSGGDLEWFFDEWVYGGGAPAYRYGWREHEIRGMRYLELSIEQTQNESPFAMPLQLAFEVPGGPSTATVWNHARVQHYLIPVTGPVDGVELDPETWILTRSVTEAEFVGGPPKLVAVEPAPGAALRAGERLDLRLTFHDEVAIEPSDIVLRRRGGGEVLFELAYDRQSLTATVSSRLPLAGGAYEVVIADSVVGAGSGLALDGEMDGTAGLPSGDGVAGGAAVIEFTALGTLRAGARRSFGTLQASGPAVTP